MTELHGAKERCGEGGEDVNNMNLVKQRRQHPLATIFGKFNVQRRSVAIVGELMRHCARLGDPLVLCIFHDAFRVRQSPASRAKQHAKAIGVGVEVYTPTPPKKRMQRSQTVIWLLKHLHPALVASLPHHQAQTGN
jgi:hypothetical protein